MDCPAKPPAGVAREVGSSKPVTPTRIDGTLACLQLVGKHMGCALERLGALRRWRGRWWGCSAGFPHRRPLTRPFGAIAEHDLADLALVLAVNAGPPGLRQYNSGSRSTLLTTFDGAKGPGHEGEGEEGGNSPSPAGEPPDACEERSFYRTSHRDVACHVVPPPVALPQRRPMPTPQGAGRPVEDTSFNGPSSRTTPDEPRESQSQGPQGIRIPQVRGGHVAIIQCPRHTCIDNSFDLL